MGVDDLMISSTSDTEAQMQEALQHGIVPNDTEPALSVVDADEPDTKAEEKPAAKVEAPETEEKPADVKVEEKPAEKKVEKKADEKKTEAKPEGKVRPKREEFDTEDEYLDSALGHRANKRIDKLTFEREEGKRKIDALESRLAALEKPADKKADTPAKVAPKYEDFETQEEWMKASIAFETEQRVGSAVEAALEKERAKLVESDNAIELEEKHRAFIESKADARTRYEDLDEVIKDNEDMPLSGVMNYVILNNPDLSHDISYYLATHREEAAEIFALEGPDQILAMGELKAKIKHIVATAKGKADAADEKKTEKPAEKKVEIEPAPKKLKAVTKMDDPIEPVGGRATKTEVPMEDLDQRAFVEKRNQEERNRKKYRK